jgi:hypothetical protein
LNVPLPKEPVAISNNAFRFQLQSPLNVHTYDLSNGDPDKQVIHHPRPYLCRDLRCIPGTIPLPNLTVNNKAVVFCMSRAIVQNLCYVLHIVQLLDIESAPATSFFGFPILRLCQLWLQLPVAIGNVLALYVIFPRTTLHVGDDV